MKNGWIIGEMDKSYDVFKQKWHNNLPLDCSYPGGLERYTRFEMLHPQASNQSNILNFWCFRIDFLTSLPVLPPSSRFRLEK